MSRGDGPAPLPPGPAAPTTAPFDVVAAEALRAHLDRVRAAALALLDTRVAAQGHLSDWSGPHRVAHDARAAACERVLAEAAAAVGRDLGRLRAAQDDAAGRARRVG